MPSPCPTLGQARGELRHELDPRPGGVPVTLPLCPHVLFPCWQHGILRQSGVHGAGAVPVWGCCSQWVPPRGCLVLSMNVVGTSAPFLSPKSIPCSPVFWQDCALLLARLAHVSPPRLRPPASCQPSGCSLSCLGPCSESWDTGDVLLVMKKLPLAHAITGAIFVPVGYCTVLATTLVSCWPSLGGDSAIWRGQGHPWPGES